MVHEEGDDTVALTHDDLTQLMEMVRAGGDVDVVRESVELVLQALIEAEVTEVIGTGPHERTEARTNQRNGARARLLSTKAGDVELRIPKLRRGSFFPAVLEPASYRPGVVRGGDGGRRVHGVSTRKVDDLVAALGEDGAFWLAFLRSLRARGLAGVELVISDAHQGLVSAVEAVMIGAAWQRCRVHFMGNVLAKIPKASGEMVAAAIRTIFSQPDATLVHAQFDEITTMLEAKFPVVADSMNKLYDTDDPPALPDEITPAKIAS
jgi:transposase-like protein